MIGGDHFQSYLTSTVMEAVNFLSSQPANKKASESRSVSMKEIETYVMKTVQEVIQDNSTLSKVLQNVVATGLLEMLPSGEFITKSTNSIPKPKLSARKEQVAIWQKWPNNRMVLRKSREKHLLSSTSVLSETNVQICNNFCPTDDVNRISEKENISKFSNIREHESCVDSKVKFSKGSLAWQHMNPTTCTLCKTSDDEHLNLCYGCGNGYHINCHVPPVKKIPNEKWFCRYCCKDSLYNIKKRPKPSLMRIPNSSNCSNPCLPEARDQELSHISKECFENYPAIIPQVANWSIEDVEMFFKGIGFIQEAPAFRKKEIDGRSLLLLKRNDVLTGLALKLGSALKIYVHIKRLQDGVINS